MNYCMQYVNDSEYLYVKLYSLRSVGSAFCYTQRIKTDNI